MNELRAEKIFIYLFFGEKKTFPRLADAGQLSCYACSPSGCEKYVEVTCPSGFDYCLTA